MTKYRELYNLDPSLRLEIDISDKESSHVQSEKLFAAVQSDVFTTRLLQTAWEEYRRDRWYLTLQQFNFRVSISIVTAATSYFLGYDNNSNLHYLYVFK